MHSGPPPTGYTFDIYFASMLAGLWFWDYANTIHFDFKLIYGRYPLRIASAAYLSMRILLTAALVVFFAVQQGFTRIDCGAAWISSVVFYVLTLMTGKGVYVCRAAAAWDHRPEVFFPILLLWLVLTAGGLVQIGAFKFVSTHASPLRWMCIPVRSNLAPTRWYICGGMLFDALIAGLTLMKLYQTSNISLLNLVFRDAWVFGLCSILPSLSCLIALHFSEPGTVFTIFLPLALVTDVILASYAYRSAFHAGAKMLQSGSKSAIRVLNGEVLTANALRQLAFRMGTVTADMGQEPEAPGHTGAAERSYLPGKLSRVHHDSSPPFATCTGSLGHRASEDKGNFGGSLTYLPAHPEAAVRKRGSSDVRGVRVGINVSVNVEIPDSASVAELDKAMLDWLSRAKSFQ
ncbi:hypothetical protein CF319_g1734 [Tilletia indica]|nr:hypothetical protein CF319_g1734 [Tilletia indica]